MTANLIDDLGLEFQGDRGHKHFPRLASLIEAETPQVLEVGTWAGNSLIAWDKAFGGKARLTAVDTWAPYWPPGESVMGDNMSRVAESGEILDRFLANIQAHGMIVRVSVLRGDSRLVLQELIIRGQQFDLIYIDGDHRHERVNLDVQNGIILTRVGGILCGDDLECQVSELDDLNAHRVALQEDRDFLPHSNHRGRMLDGTPYSGHHPGVTQAVADAFYGIDVSCFDSLWAMRRTSVAGWERI